MKSNWELMIERRAISLPEWNEGRKGARGPQRKANQKNDEMKWNHLLIAAASAGLNGRVGWLICGGLWAARGHNAPQRKRPAQPNSSFLSICDWIWWNQMNEQIEKEMEWRSPINQTRKEGRGRLSFVVGYGAEPICAPALTFIDSTNQFQFSCLAFSLH